MIPGAKHNSVAMCKRTILSLWKQNKKLIEANKMLRFERRMLLTKKGNYSP